MGQADFCRLRQDLFVKPLATSNGRCQKGHLLSVIPAHQMGENLLGGLRGNLQITTGAVLHAYFGIEQAEIVIHLGHGGHGGFAAAARDALLNGYRRRHAANDVDFRPTKRRQKLPGIGRQAFHIAALPLGKDNVKGQGRFARATEPGDHHELIARNVDVDIFEIVVPGAINRNAMVIDFRHPCRQMRMRQAINRFGVLVEIVAQKLAGVRRLT